MDYEQVRTLLLEVLRSMLGELKNGQTNAAQYSHDMQFGVLEVRVQRLVGRRGMASSSDTGLSIDEKQYLAQALWELIIEGVLIPGYPGGGGWPSVSLTQHGQKVVLEQIYSPYDPAGYLSQLKGDILDFDAVAMFYLEEALGSFRANRFAASTVMLGVASERLFDILFESFLEALASEERRQELRRRTEGRFVTQRYDELRKNLDPRKNQLPKELTENLDTYLSSIFNIIREYRNDAGHPTGKQIGRDKAYANLYVFASYCKQMYALVHFFGAKPKSLS